MYLNISLILKNREFVAISQALEEFDMDKALKDFSMEACKKADLYPDIWDYLEEEEEIKDDILTCFVKNERLLQGNLKPQGECLSDHLLRFLYSIRKVVP